MNKILIDRNWLFSGKDESGPIYRAFNKSGAWLSGAEARDYNDSSWEKINIPHDYVINGTPVPSKKKEKISEIPAMQAMDSMLTANGSLERYVAWYRKHLFFDHKDKGDKIFIRFDGVFRNSSFYFNGFYLDTHLSGYTPILLDITDFIEYGEKNVISIKVDPRIPEGWWYEGGGIYRHVWLLKVPSVYTLEEDTFIHSEIDLKQNFASVNIETIMTNSTNCDETVDINYKIIDPSGKCVNMSNNTCIIKKNDNKKVKNEVTLKNPILWNLDSPFMYNLQITLSNGLFLTIPFGLRKIEFSNKKGFLLNGDSIKIRGVCMHQDHAGVGVAMFDGLHEYRIKKLKEMGCNAYRCSHHPPTPELLDACDRLGMLVLNETRLLSSSPEDIRQLKSMVSRDRNHPSVIMYSIGNEEIHVQFRKCGTAIAHTMCSIVKKLDCSRPITEALLFWDSEENKIINDISLADGLINEVDVIGVNYTESNWDNLNKRHPEKPFLITEASTFPHTRGCARTFPQSCRLGIMDKNGDKFIEGERHWQMVNSRDYIMGMFIWTGFDYHGEPTPFGWPGVISQFGVFDLCGFKKDSYYYYASWWQQKPVLHLIKNFDCNNSNNTLEIWCFSNCQEVELFIGAKSLGVKKMKRDEHLVWEITNYRQGELSAKGYNNNELVAEYSIITTDKPKCLVVKNDGKYISKDSREYYIFNIHVEDDKGNAVTHADNEILFVLEGGGKIVGSGNGDPMCHLPSKTNYRRLFSGRAQVIIEKESNEEVILKIESEGLISAIEHL